MNLCVCNPEFAMFQFIALFACAPFFLFYFFFFFFLKTIILLNRLQLVFFFCFFFFFFFFYLEINFIDHNAEYTLLN